jgi:hypothetical protein
MCSRFHFWAKSATFESRQESSFFDQYQINFKNTHSNHPHEQSIVLPNKSNNFFNVPTIPRPEILSNRLSTIHAIQKKLKKTVDMKIFQSI